LTIVVFIVAVAVFLVVWKLTASFAGTIFRFHLCTVPAVANFAIFLVSLISAAITTIPIAATNIIVVITESIALELGSATTLLEVVDTLITFLYVCAVLAFTLLAVFVIFGTATVASIPVATSDIVVIVTIAIAFPVGCTTTFADGFNTVVALSFVGAVLALAFLAKFVAVFWTTAITLVPVQPALLLSSSQNLSPT